MPLPLPPPPPPPHPMPLPYGPPRLRLILVPEPLQRPPSVGRCCLPLEYGLPLTSVIIKLISLLCLIFVISGGLLLFFCGDVFMMLVEKVDRCLISLSSSFWVDNLFGERLGEYGFFDLLGSSKLTKYSLEVFGFCMIKGFSFYSA